MHIHYVDFRDFENLNLSCFHLIIIHYSVRVAYSYMSRETEEKLREFDGGKALFIQDEYDYVNRSVEFINNAKLDLVFTCVPQQQIGFVYKQVKDPSVSFVTVLTGFIEAEEKASSWVPYLERKIDVGYRGRRLHHRYGRLGFEKWQIGEIFREKTFEIMPGIVMDISSKEEDRLYGDSWRKWLGQCRAVLGVESGCNVFDFDGSLEELSQKHSNMSFEEFERKFLIDMEKPGTMNQISPRIFEAITEGNLLILFPGDYSGILKEWIHYVPLRRDFSNLEEVLSVVRNEQEAMGLINRAYKDVVQSKKWNEKSYFDEIWGHLQSISRKRNLQLDRCLHVSDKSLANIPFIARGIVATESTEDNLHYFYRIARKVWRVIPVRHRQILFLKISRFIK